MKLPDCLLLLEKSTRSFTHTHTHTLTTMCKHKFSSEMAAAMDKPKHKNPASPVAVAVIRNSMIKFVFILPLALLILVLAVIRLYSFPDDSQLFQFTDAQEINSIPPVSGDYSYSTQADEVELLGGLLASGFEEGSCLSRYRSASYRKPSSYKPSSHLLSKLRRYEDLHRRCGPHTKSYNKTVELLNAGQSLGPTDCNYLVWASFGPVQNRLLSLASAFLYALLTNRVLLVDRGKGMSDLLCEPFPNMSWLLPLNFPVADKLNSLYQNSSNSYGHMMKNNLISYSKRSLPAFIYLHLVHDYDEHDKLFFCDQDQSVLQNAPWLIMKTDNYFVPSLFLIPSFEQELNSLFPERQFVFHHLGRYLFHPSNQVWGLITKYHHAYLAKGDERVGIQIETFDAITQPFSYVMNQILSCTSIEKILPRVTMEQSESVHSQPKTPKSIAVLVSSSNSGYYEKLKSIYEDHTTVNGEIVSIYQVSDAEYEDDEEMIARNQKLWAEMFLLSLTDVLITSSQSTFGYVAHGLRGWTPWILLNPRNENDMSMPARLAYRLALSIEPCFQAPPLVDCNSKNKLYSRSVVDHVRYCEDVIDGIKLVDGLSDDIS